MTKVVRVHKVGGPEALVYEAVDLAAPGPGEVRLHQHAVGLNFIDVYYRTGLYKAPGLPFIAGNEAAGEVIAVGPGREIRGRASHHQDAGTGVPGADRGGVGCRRIQIPHPARLYLFCHRVFGSG